MIWLFDVKSGKLIQTLYDAKCRDKAQAIKGVGTRVQNDRIIIMSIKYSEYLDAVAIKYRTLSYNDLAPKAVLVHYRGST